MRTLLQLAAILTLTGVSAAHAQITSPDLLVAPPPRNPAEHHPLRSQTNDLQWLWQYATPAPLGRAADLRLDPHFPSLLSDNLQALQALWGEHRPLTEVIPSFLTKYGTVTAEDNRYVTVDGCVPSFCPAHGMLWVDLGARRPLVVFAAVTWTAEGHTTDETGAGYNLWVFPSRTLSADAIPSALSRSIVHWDERLAAAHRLVPHIANALLVDTDGTPHSVDPGLIGANSLPPQPDTVTPPDPDATNE